MNDFTPAGVVPRLKQMTVVGTFDSGHFEYESGLALPHEEDAARIFDSIGEGSDNGTHPSPGRRARAIRAIAAD